MKTIFEEKTAVISVKIAQKREKSAFFTHFSAFSTVLSKQKPVDEAAKAAVDLKT